MFTEKEKKLRLAKQYYKYHLIYRIGSFFTEAFFIILLYKSTNSFEYLSLERAFWAIGVLVSYLISSFAVQRFGYRGIFRLSMLFLFISSILTFFFINEIGALYPIFSIFRGMGTGSLFTIINLFDLKEFSLRKRNSIVNIWGSINNILSVLLPTVVGGVIVLNNGYQIAYLIGTIIYLIGMLYPFQYNKHPKSKINSSEITQIISAKGFLPYAIISIVTSARNITLTIVLLITPYLFIGNEFGVGVFASAINIFAAIMFFINRNTKIAEEVKRGYLGIILFSLATTIFSFIWTLPALVFRNLTYTIVSPFIDPISSNMEISIKSKILGKHINESAVEMNIVLEVLYFIGRISGAFLVTFAIVQYPNNVVTLFKFIVLLSGIWALIRYILLAQMSDAKHSHS